MLIRKFRKEDAVTASHIVKKGFQVNNAPDYGKASIKEQVEANSPKNLIEKAKKVKYFVAVEEDRILGIGGYDRQKVHTLFVDPNLQRKGIGTKILERILSEAKKDGIKVLDAWSTFQAEKFYSDAGFKRIKEFTLKCQRSSIDFILMRKRV
ncbi:MAG: GNAT family N-acetyltransferase [Candidatus Micrarchaeota archaeon]|nr:GNAT family N-acetyltransferase [Candidatus Micrarchaeota archaeon]